MKIDSVNQAVVNPQKIKDEILKAKEAQSAAEESEQIEEQIPTIENNKNTDEQEDMPGVLRLLQEGHFNSVSALRLSINFHEEIMLIQNGEVKAAVERDINIVVTAVRVEVDNFSASESLTDEQKTAIAGFSDLFGIDANAAKDKFVNSDAGKFDDLTNELKDALNKLVEAIRALFEPPTELQNDNQTAEQTQENGATAIQPTGEENQQPAETTEPQTDMWSIVNEFLSSLNQIFDNAMSQFTDGINSVNILPPTTEPDNNGKAYDKFLAIYNDVYGVNPDNIAAQENNEVLV